MGGEGSLQLRSKTTLKAMNDIISFVSKSPPVDEECSLPELHLKYLSKLKLLLNEINSVLPSWLLGKPGMLKAIANLSLMLNDALPFKALRERG